MDNLHIFLFIFCFTGLGITTLNAEPIRGTNVIPAENGKYSFVVSIEIKNNQLNAEEKHFCTGALISKEHILTAAHCFMGHLLGEIQVILGSVDLRNGTKYNPSLWITYDQWAKDKKIKKEFEMNDIAIIKLSDEVKPTIAKPTKISITEPSKLDKKTVTVAGWGFTNNNTKTSRYLQKANVTVMTNKECEDVMMVITNERIPMKKSYFCTRTVPFNLIDCGDSGGPVLNEKNEIVAVNKGTCPKPQLEYPQKFVDQYKVNVHASVHYYSKFIKDVLKNY